MYDHNRLPDLDEPDELAPVCENGCPDGALGRHKMSCEWAGIWFWGDRHVLVTGVSGDRATLCIAHGAGEHAHVPAEALRHVKVAL